MQQGLCSQISKKSLSLDAIHMRFPQGVSLYTVKIDYSFLCMWMTSYWLDRNRTLIRCGKYSIKRSIWENQHLSLIMYTWDVHKDNVKKAKILLTITEPCLNQEFPQGGTEKLPFPQNLRISSWSYDMEGHAKKCVERFCEPANKTIQQLWYLLLASMTTTSKKKK